MRIVRIYSAEPLAAGIELELPESAARHIVQVLRMQAGGELVLFDGSGVEYPGTIVAASKTRVSVQLGIAAEPPVESDIHISLWHSLCRGDRMDTVVQKATELGASEIQPVITERGLLRLDSKRAARKLDHWRSIAISACEQSGRVRIPVVHPIASLDECLQMHRARQTSPVTALMCDPDGATGLRSLLHPGPGIIALTGPEGGFSGNEKAAATDAGFTLVSLGPRILRTETAPTVVLSIVQSVLGDLEARQATAVQ